MLKRLCILAAAALAANAASAQDGPPPPPDGPPPATETVVLETTVGDIVLAIETERAPITSANFLRYVDEDRFDGVAFYRAMRLDWGEQPNGLIQAGTNSDPKRTLPAIPHEPTSETGVKHVEGAISMARWAPGTATGDFAIYLRASPGMNADPSSDNPERRAGYAAFGHVVEGMDVVRAIHAAPTDPVKGTGWMKGQMLAEPVRIIDARRAGD